MPPVLIALSAELVLHKGGRQRKVGIEDFFTGYRSTILEQGEFIEAIEIPRARPGAMLYVYKNTKRFDDDISTSLGVFHVAFGDRGVEYISIAFGGMAAVPKRALHTECALRGGSLDNDAMARAKAALAEDFQPIDDVRAGADYRLALARGFLERMRHELLQPGNVHRVHRYVAV